MKSTDYRNGYSRGAADAAAGFAVASWKLGGYPSDYVDGYNDAHAAAADAALQMELF